MKKVLKQTIHKIKKTFRASYKKSPVLTIIAAITVGIIVLGGSAYGIYRLATQPSQTPTPATFEDDKSPANSDADSSKDSDKPDDSSSSVPDSVDCKDSSSLFAVQDSITIDTPHYAYSINVRSSDGKEFTPLQVSTSPSFESATPKLELPGFVVWEKSADQPSSSTRFIYFKQLDAASSGSAVVYVFAGCQYKPAAINVSWSPHAEMHVEEAGHSRVVNGDVESYEFHFKIAPNDYFGTPTLNLRLAGDYADYCDSGSVKSISTTYDGTTSFTLTCEFTVPLPACTPPATNNCQPYFQVYVSASSSNGDPVSATGKTYFVYYF